MTQDFSEIVFLKAGGTAVQARADIPAGAKELALIFSDENSTRNSKHLTRLANALFERGTGSLIVDILDEVEMCELEVVQNKAFLQARVRTIAQEIRAHKIFGALFHLVYCGDDYKQTLYSNGFTSFIDLSGQRI